MSDDVVLLDAQLGTQHVRVWIEADDSSIRIVSHEVGPGLLRTVGKGELAAFLEVDADQVSAIYAALVAERADPSAPQAELGQLLLEKYRGDSTATGNFRAWLDGHGIPYRFTLV